MRIGIHKRWSQGFLIKQLAAKIPEYSGLDVSEWGEHLAAWGKSEAIIDAMAGGDLEALDSIYGLVHLNFAWLPRMRRAEYELLLGRSTDLAAVAAAFRYRWVDHIVRTGAWVTNWEKPNPYACSINDIAETVPRAYSLGWCAQADRLMDMLLALVPKGAVWTESCWDMRWAQQREPFGRFTIALYADFAGTELPPMPPHEFPPTPCDDLLAVWRTPDAEALVEPLLAFCDWHTHECMVTGSMDPRKRKAFQDDTLMGWPVGVHMVYRLRERLGFPLPATLDHPLMATPFGPYRSPQPIPPDERLERIIQQAYQAVPGLEDALQGVLHRV